MVMDNHSQDQSIAYIKSHFPQIRLLESRENLGFGGGNNLAARQAQGRYVVFLNNDMMVDPLFVQELIQTVQSDPEAVCASAKILNWDGSRIDFGGAAAHFAGFAYQVGFQKPVSARSLYSNPTHSVPLRRGHVDRPEGLPGGRRF